MHRNRLRVDHTHLPWRGRHFVLFWAESIRQFLLVRPYAVGRHVLLGSYSTGGTEQTRFDFPRVWRACPGLRICRISGLKFPSEDSMTTKLKIADRSVARSLWCGDGCRYEHLEERMNGRPAKTVPSLPITPAVRHAVRCEIDLFYPSNVIRTYRRLCAGSSHGMSFLTNNRCPARKQAIPTSCEEDLFFFREKSVQLVV